MYIFTHKNYFLLILLSALFSGCGGSTTIAEALQTEESIDNTTPGYKAIQQGQVRDILTEEALENVKVSINDISTLTDKNGYYTLSNLPENQNTIVNFEKNGYLLGSTHIYLNNKLNDGSISSNYLEHTMYAHDMLWSQDTHEAISRTNINTNANNYYVDIEGNHYDGIIAIKLGVLSHEEETFLSVFPGAFKGLNIDKKIVSFISYGIINISLYDNKNNVLNLADGESATLTFDIGTSKKDKNTIPMWYYDQKTGLWVEEGFAQLETDGSYKGEVSHFGTWSLSQPIEKDSGLYRGYIVNSDGLPISHVRLFAKGDNWMSTDISIDQNGYFEIEVIPDSSFNLSAYNYKDKYTANYNSTISAIASGEIVED